ncbi:unnamed protein product [Linum tenue]|uniref:Gamma-interferon-inducible lysosomal thiol reductase n=1 Tax=Linum tenue TaxID=586396 RepID=A0AAV0KT69_9ROSI|nr:unnamed protein product [Linum tenue]
MASPPFLPLLLLLLSLLLLSPPQSYSYESDKVNLTLYYETGCPYCRDFIIHPLAEAMGSDLVNIVNLKLVPWGNAYSIGSTIVCQHGEDECLLNRIHACIIAVARQPYMFDIIECTEEEEEQQAANNMSSNPSAVWTYCVDKLRFPKSPIEHCSNSGMGEKLLLKYGYDTTHLKPPLRGVPWVTVNGIPLAQEYKKFVSYVCNAYKGKSLPSACRKSSHDIEKSSNEEQMCYRA